MKQALVIRHLAFEDLGHFAPALRAAGYGIEYHDVGEDDIATRDAHAADLLVILGGPIGAYEDTAYPFLNDELRIIGARLEAEQPTLGICLGAQLIARAAGARVYPSGSREIGFAPIRLTAAGRVSCLAPFERDPITLHWHGDTFDLPAGAELLASTVLCENQAFALGSNVIGFQFHPEVDLQRIEKWLVGHAVELAHAGVEVGALRESARRLEDGWQGKSRSVVDTWLRRLDSGG